MTPRTGCGPSFSKWEAVEMPYILSSSYSLSSRRGIGNADVLNHIRITPVPFVGAGNAIDFIDITYNATTQFLVGDIPPSAPRSVFAFFSREDFDVHRHVFQSEAPIELESDVDPNDL